MNSILGKSTGIALLLAAAMLAALFAMGVFSATGVGAHGNHTQVEVKDSVASITTGGATVRLTLSAKLSANVGDEIIIEFEENKFGLPDDDDAVDANHVTISSVKGSGNPADVEVSGDKIILIFGGIGENNPSDISNASTSIIISKNAGITNPTKAGIYDITIKDEHAATTDTNAHVVVERKISVDPKKGGSGAEVTIKGTGFADGAVDVYTVKLDNEGKPVDPVVADMELGTGVAVTDGAFSLTTTDLTEKSHINAIDGDGNSAGAEAVYTVTQSFSVSGPGGDDEISLAETLTISLKDWPTNAGDDIYDDVEKAVVTGVSIGGSSVMVFLGENDDNFVSSSDISSGAGTIKVKVPGIARTGKQTVQLWTGLEWKTSDALTFTGTPKLVAGVSDSITVNPLTLTVTPQTAVPGQQVTVRGTGFAGGNNAALRVTTIEVDGIKVNPRDISGSSNTTSAGALNVTFTIPTIDSEDEDKAIATGSLVIEVTEGSERVGEAMVEVPKASITLDPTESSYGTRVTVKGEGFVANDSVDIIYAASEEDDEIGIARTDSAGSFETTIEVPSFAEVGESHKVTAEDRDSVRSASADHSLPKATLSFDPEQAVTGQTLTVTGNNFPLYTNVNELIIGRTDVLTSPKPLTDGNGSFSVTLTVPQLGLGNQSLFVRVGSKDTGPQVSESVEVVEASTAPVITDPAELFAGLGARLLRVWELDNATQTWSFYDPRPDRADFNSLTEVSSGDIATIIISSGDPIEFQGSNLYSGTNLVALK